MKAVEKAVEIIDENSATLRTTYKDLEGFMGVLESYIWYLKNFHRKEYISIEVNEKIFDKVNEIINNDDKLKKDIEELNICFVKCK